MSTAARIFVSYAFEDDAWCRAFVEALRLGGASVWYDKYHLGYGVLGEKIEQELRASPIFIVALSPAAVAKPWVRREMDAAMGLKDKHPERIVLPVIVERADIPLMWGAYTRVSGLGDTGMDAIEAAGQVVAMLRIVPRDTAGAPSPEDMQAAADLASLGNSFYAQMRYLKALSSYEQALALNPLVAEVWTAKGDVLYDLQRHVEALAAYDEALNREPENADIWNNLGNVLAALHQSEQALSVYERALALDSQADDVWSNKGSVLQELGRLEEALSALEQALTLDPESAAAWYNKGSVLQDLERYTEALAAFEQALTLNPTDVDVWNSLITVLGQLERRDEARDVEYERDLALGTR
jgi:tetratricopeptide (TPR) repeat protein